MKLDINGTFPFIHKSEERGIKTGTGQDGGMPMTFDYWYDYNKFGTSAAGVTVDKDTALKQSAYWRAVNLISSQIAAFPVGLYKRLENGDTQEIKDHPAVKLLKRRPNNLQNSLIWRESMQGCVLTRGNGYSEIARLNNGDPASLEILDPGDIEPRILNGSLVYDYNGRAIDPFFMLHIPSLSFNGIKGISVLEAGAESMGINLAMHKFKASVFKNGAKQTGVLSHPGQLSANATDGLRRSFDKKMASKEGGTVVLDEGMKFHPITWSPLDAQLLQLEQLGIQDIARFFGVPPHLLFEESRSTFNNISEQGLEFVRYTLTQWVARWEAELNSKLLAEDEAVDHFFKLNMNSLLRGDLKTRYEAYAIGKEKGWLSSNEIREWEDMNKIEGGDSYTEQLNKGPLGGE